MLQLTPNEVEALYDWKDKPEQLCQDQEVQEPGKEPTCTYRPVNRVRL